MHTKNINKERSDSKMNKKLEELLENMSDKEIELFLSASEQDVELIKEINKQKISKHEVGKVINNLRNINPKKYKTKRINYTDKHIRIGWFTDAHMGHKNYRRDVLRDMARYFKKTGVEFIVNAGDTIEGMSGREGHIYELDRIGYSQQLKFFAEEMQVLDKWDVYSIEAQDSHSGWYHNKANMGVDIGEEMQKAAPNYKFLGYDEQDLVLDNGLKLRLRHPGGGTAYAISYKIQKYVESISGGNKPHILLEGHFHKYNQLFYRNIQCIDGGALQNQSDFMKKKGTPSHVGFGVMDIYHKKTKGIERFITEWIPYYD